VIKTLFDPLLGPRGPQPIKDALYGTWVGHPLHPAVTDIPIGCWTTTLVLDLTGSERGADIALKAGVAGALASVVTGVAQWQDLQYADEPRRVGTMHALLNTTALTLYLGSWVARSGGARPLGIALSSAGYGLTTAAGFLGGHLAYHLGIGVARDAFEAPPTDWVEAASMADLEEGVLKRVRVKNQPVVLLKVGDEIYATTATCSHLGGPLNQGQVEGTCVTCPWHASVFDMRDGSVVHGPATTAIHAYETRVEGDRILVRSAGS
jgi:nitrite reductase/ring-hydroxylating ferredoxin subunit/uncharacterized membrane protein